MREYTANSESDEFAAGILAFVRRATDGRHSSDARKLVEMMMPGKSRGQIERVISSLTHMTC